MSCKEPEVKPEPRVCINYILISIVLLTSLGFWGPL